MDAPAFVENFDPVWIAIPFFVLSVFGEMLFARFTGKARFEARDSAASLMMGLGNTVSGVIFGGLIGLWALFVYEHRLTTIGFAWWAWILAFMLDDFVYYWSHRWAHTVRWFWADHVVHHSSQHYNLTTALRQPWLNPLTLKFLWLGSALIFLGFHPAMVAFVGSLNLIYQFWIHTEAIRKMPPWFEAVMNTPSHHRVHHATNPLYLDRNYAGVFIIWDKMFGTFQPELDDEKCRYGIVKNLGTYNPIKISLHEWWGILKDMASAKNPKEALMYLLAPPGWSPDGSRQTSHQILDRWKARQADKPDMPTAAE
ncbi:MAG: sterol desaturase family protein [Alphaproteobacteria bacterium]|uniref:sterol desaturase family protein n=1 Tax=Maricaulis alexandrii TaxID=2570354 RepID=UPI0011090433|nr:sterol desaturase family protein [Maricaulis alexandrii]MCR9266372.1 sterol desaturase family protein [Alphaproteobacteria bacterium]